MPGKPLRPCARCRRALTVERLCAGCAEVERGAYDQARGSSAARGYGGAWRRLRARILARDPVCRTEGCGRPATEVDHIVPRARGGTDDDDNLQGLCKPCHSRKTATEDGRWG